MKASTCLREAIHHTLQQCDNDLEAQRIATEYAYRKRIHEFERAKGELEWQKKNVSERNQVQYNQFQWSKENLNDEFSKMLLQTEEEIAELENDIRGIEEKIRAKIAPMKLAQTRLENRTYRPNVELCRDAPQYGLTDEVKQLEATKRALEEKLKQAKYVIFVIK